MKKKFAYCIGGCRSVPPFLDALTSERSDCFPIFFKEPGPPGSIYLPNSTTNTGRNEAFRQASAGDYEYVIIMDDDVSFEGLTHAEGFRKFNEVEIINHLSGKYPRHGQCVAADAYLMEMTLPEWRHRLGKYRDAESFHAVEPLLRPEGYKFTREQVGKFFDLSHPYWAGRV